MSDPMIVGSSITTPSTEQPASTEHGSRARRAGEGTQPWPLGDAWHDLRRKPLFWISSVLILILLLMAAFPQLFASGRPGDRQPEAAAWNRRRRDAWFGYDIQGYNVYARAIYGARTSILVGVLAVARHLAASAG